MSKIAILGAAESGVGAAVLALNKGYDVFVSDMGMIKEHYKEILIYNSKIFVNNYFLSTSIYAITILSYESQSRKIRFCKFP